MTAPATTAGPGPAAPGPPPGGGVRLAYLARYGQLGNSLFTFAHLIAHAAERGHTVTNLAFGDYGRYFEGLREDPLARYPAVRPRLPRAALRAAARALPRPLRLAARCGVGRLVDVGWDGEVDLSTEAGRARLPARGTALLNGFRFRDRPAFARRAGLLREFFAPRADLAAGAAARVAAARAACDHLVGVHVRRGDYRTFNGGLYWHEPHEYADLMRRIAALHAGGRVGFLVCSNRPVDPADYPGVPVTPGPGGEATDLFALARCDALVGPPSTYTAWASFAGEVPRYLFHPKERAKHGLDDPPPAPDRFRPFDVTEEKW